MLVSLVKRGAAHALVANVTAASGQRSRLTWRGRRQLSLTGPLAIRVLSPLRLAIETPELKVSVSQGFYKKNTGELGGMSRGAELGVCGSRPQKRLQAACPLRIPSWLPQHGLERGPLAAGTYWRCAGQKLQAGCTCGGSTGQGIGHTEPRGSAGQDWHLAVAARGYGFAHGVLSMQYPDTIQPAQAQLWACGP